MKSYLIKKNHTAVFLIFIILSVVIFISSCGKKNTGNSLSLMEELQAVDIGRYIDSVPYSGFYRMQSDPAWIIYKYNKSVCKCIFDDEFHIGFKKKTETENIVFVMSGGGACWEGNAACNKTANLPSGWKDTAGSPFNGWSVIHVPYCDGSIHMGDNVINYDGRVHNHMGLKLTTAGVSILKKINPDPPKILITGSSAGGYGTFMAYLLIRRFFPDSALYIFNDAGPGLWNPDNKIIEKINKAWKYNSFFPKSCENCNDQLIYLYDWILQRDSNLKIGIFSSYNDSTIGDYYLQMNTANTPDAYKKLLISTSEEIQKKHPARFKRFFIDTNTHCVSNTTGNYSYKIQGESLAIWIKNMIYDKPGWNDLLE